MSKRVSLFVTCIVDQLFPKVGMAMADVLERLGYQVDFPEAQTCCGQPAFNSGYREEARAVARHSCDVFRDAEYVVVPSGSCTSMITHHFAELFPRRAGDAGAGARPGAAGLGVFEVPDGSGEGGGRGRALGRRGHFHDSCHALRELGIKEGPRRLLAHVRGLELREMDTAEECCGFGGTFSVKFAGDLRRHGAHQGRFHRAHRARRPWWLSIPVA